MCTCHLVDDRICCWCSSQVRNTAIAPKPEATQLEKDMDRFHERLVKERLAWRDFYGFGQ